MPSYKLRAKFNFTVMWTMCCVIMLLELDSVLRLHVTILWWVVGNQVNRLYAKFIRICNFQMWENMMSREVIIIKLLSKIISRETKVYTLRKRDGEKFYTVNFYLGKWFWGIQYRFAGNAYLSIVVYSVFRFSRWQWGTTPELLWYIRSLKATAPLLVVLCLYFQALKRKSGE